MANQNQKVKKKIYYKEAQYKQQEKKKHARKIQRNA